MLRMKSTTYMPVGAFILLNSCCRDYYRKGRTDHGFCPEYSKGSTQPDCCYGQYKGTVDLDWLKFE